MPKITFNEPLNMPQGSVRAIITIMLVSGTIALAFLSLLIKVDTADPAILAMTSMATLAVGHYFGARSKETNELDRSQTQTAVVPDEGVTEAGDDPDEPNLEGAPTPGGAPSSDDPSK